MNAQLVLVETQFIKEGDLIYDPSWDELVKVLSNVALESSLENMNEEQRKLTLKRHSGEEKIFETYSHTQLNKLIYLDRILIEFDFDCKL